MRVSNGQSMVIGASTAAGMAAISTPVSFFPFLLVPCFGLNGLGGLPGILVIGLVKAAALKDNPGADSNLPSKSSIRAGRAAG